MTGARMRNSCGLSAVLSVAVLAVGAANAENVLHLNLNLSWGHTSPASSPFHIQFLGQNVTIDRHTDQDLESGDTYESGVWSTTAGGGDTDGVALQLSFPVTPVREIENLQSIWAYLIKHSDSDTARRLTADPGYRPDPRKLTVQLNEAGTRGFSLTIDQIQQNKVLWVPELDLFIAAGDTPIHFGKHQAELKQWAGTRVLDQMRAEPEATYEQYKALWEDMGSPAYKNPHSVGPGHIICVTWDSATHKFGIDRGAGIWSDYGNPDKHRFWYDFGDLSAGIADSWKDQRLAGGLPVITTVFEKDGIRCEVEQFAYPLDGPPQERHGDISMVLMQRVSVVNTSGAEREVSIVVNHQRELPADAQLSVVRHNEGTFWFEDRSAGRVLLMVRGEDLAVRDVTDDGTQPPGQEKKDSNRRTSRLAISCTLSDRGSHEFFVYLPSPPVAAESRAELAGLSYDRARTETIQFWSGYIARGARFHVPEEAVNELFRANLWHALRLPRRHGGSEPGVHIDLPYSNFAYDQKDTPWPVNQAVYVDYMLYDLRGYHDISAEELAAMFRNNQEPNGHIGGYANWGVYTSGMIYAVAKHYLLSGDRASFETLLPQTLKALDWSIETIRAASQRGGPCSGLVLAPLNDLSHDERAWAFNQAYLFAGLDMLARALAEIGHPRATECRAAAQAMYDAIQRSYAYASVQSPLIQLRDHTWMPYVPCDVLTPRRLLEVWYPTDVDTGALHMARLKALDPTGPLTMYLLNDHEDNLFYRQWGMANEPVYNQHASAYLWRDEPEAAIRAFYSMCACAFSHTVFESVEHRWGWGQYFCPPSTDGAWFELYRNMLIQERDDDSLLLLQATPRRWLEQGKTIAVERAPTYYGRLSMTVEGLTTENQIRAEIDTPDRRHPRALLIRFRHPTGKPMKSVAVDGENWTDYNVEKEWVRVADPDQKRYVITVSY